MDLSDFQLDERHFRSIVTLVEGHVGIRLPPAKRSMVEGRLRKRVRALGLCDLNHYGRHVFDEDHLGDEMVHLIDCVTTNKTDFFREPAHFDILRERVVPALLKRHGTRRPRLKLWSAACSTGAEAYTMAMVLDAIVQDGGAFSFAILGTDISTTVLDHARAAIYSQEMVAQVPAAFRDRYVMLARDARRAVGRMVPELRQTVRFERLNLMDADYPVDRDVDVVFCRNVLIYFDKPTQRRVVERLMSHLRPGGYLFVGHSESMAGAGIAGLRQVLPTVFQA